MERQDPGELPILDTSTPGFVLRELTLWMKVPIGVWWTRAGTT